MIGVFHGRNALYATWAVSLIAVAALFPRVGSSQPQVQERDPLKLSLPAGASCLLELKSLVQQWGAQGPWEQDLPASDGSIVQRSPTSTVGVWVEGRSLGERTQAVRITAHTTTVVTFAAKDCTPQLQVLESHYDAQRMKKAFSDEDLVKLLDENPAGLIYVWSPHMELSVRGLVQARNAAKRLKLPLTLLLDPAADPTDAQKIAARNSIDKAGLKPMESLDLFYRGVTNHYPALLVYAKGRMVSYADPGYQPSARYVSFAQRMLAGK